MGIKTSKPTSDTSAPKILLNQRFGHLNHGDGVVQGSPPLQNIFAPVQPKSYVPPSHLLNPPAMAASTNFGAYYKHNCNHPQSLLDTLVLLRNASMVQGSSQQHIGVQVDTPANISYPPAPSDSAIGKPSSGNYPMPSAQPQGQQGDLPPTQQTTRTENASKPSQFVTVGTAVSDPMISKCAITGLHRTGTAKQVLVAYGNSDMAMYFDLESGSTKKAIKHQLQGRIFADHRDHHDGKAWKHDYLLLI